MAGFRAGRPSGKCPYEKGGESERRRGRRREKPRDGREGRVSGEGEGGERSHETTEPEAAEIQPQAVNITGSGKTPGGPSPRSWRVWSCDTLSPAV